MNAFLHFARRSRSSRAALGSALTLALAGCPSPVAPPPDVLAADAALADAPATPPDVPTAYQPADCDPLNESQCALPWPSNLYLHPDPSRATGYALTFGATSLPANRASVHPDPALFQRLDGYGLGVPIMTVFPNLDASALADEYHLERSMTADAPVLLFEVGASGALARVPYFAELDTHTSVPSRAVLFVRPAVILKEATTYIVAFRALRDTMGAAIAPSPAFAALRDGHAMDDPRLAPRAARFAAMFAKLEAAGIPRASLTLAWDFNTASGAALHGTLLQMRGAMLAAQPMGAPLTVTNATEYARTADSSGRVVNANIAFELQGTFEVPSYLRPFTLASGAMASELNRGADGAVTAMGTRAAQFWARIPWSAVDGTHTPHALLQYGHGLLGSGAEISHSDFLDALANSEHFIPFAASLTGMSSDNQPAVMAALAQLGDFRAVTDPLHQGLCEWVALARAMKLRAAALPQLASRGVQIDPAQMYYSGNSQGGIFGATYMAIAADIPRGHLGVPGQNYATLLYRSADFGGLLVLLGTQYPNAQTQALALATMQLLWDPTDPVSYYRHITTEPFTPGAPHYVLAAPARGDHQVSVLTNELAARSNLGLALMDHYDADRAVPYGLTVQTYPYTGSGLVLWHFGNPWPAPGNHPPVDALPDPHERPRRDPDHNRQVMHFLRTGELMDVCANAPCGPGR